MQALELGRAREQVAQALAQEQVQESDQVPALARAHPAHPRFAGQARRWRGSCC